MRLSRLAWLVLGLALVSCLAVLPAPGAEALTGGRSNGDVRWTTFTSEDGLVGNSVQAIWGDGQVVWFGTDQGLSRYDGIRWQSFTQADGLAGDQVQAIWGDGRGVIWIGTTTGLSRYDGQGWRTFTTKDGLPSNNVRGIWGDDDGHVWVVAEPSVEPTPPGQSSTGGVGFYDGTAWHTRWEAVSFVTEVMLYQEYSLPFWGAVSTTGGRFAAARAVAGDERGNVWVGHGLALGDGSLLSGGISRYDGTAWQRFTTENSHIPDDNVNMLWVEPGGTVWVGTARRGVARFDGHTWQAFGPEAAGETILAMWGDNQGHIWLGSWQEGATRYDGFAWRRFTSADGLASDTVQAIWGDGEGRMWFGTDQGATLYDPSGWDAFRIQSGLSDNDVQAVWGGGAGTTWLGTRSGGLVQHRAGRWRLFTEQDGLPGNQVTDIWGEGPDNIWVAFGSDGVARFDGFRWRTVRLPRRYQRFVSVYTLWGDDQGAVWLGTNNGLLRFDGQSWQAFRTDNSDLAANNVTLVMGDRAENLWIGYWFEELSPAPLPPPQPSPFSPGGVSWYDGRRWHHFTQADGLGSNNVQALWPDEEGRVWVGGFGPLSRFDGQGWRTIDGGPAGVTAIWGDDHGTLWFGSQQTMPEDSRPDGALSQELEAVITRYGGSEWRSFTTTGDGLASGKVTDIWGDGRGHVWATHSNLWGGSGGVSIYDGSHWRVWQVADGPVTPRLRALALGPEGWIWLGTRKGVSVFDGARWQNFGRENGLVSLDVEDLWIGADGQVWVAHALSTVQPEQGGVSRFDGRTWRHYGISDGLGGPDVNAIGGDNQGHVWVGGQQPSWETGKGWVARFDGARWQSFSVEGGTVEAIWGDGRGNVWFRIAEGVNTYDGREWRYYPSLREAVEVTYDDLKGTVGSNPIWTVDTEGHVWIATDNGVARYDGRDWQEFSTAIGLADDDVRAILLDRGGTLWFATGEGLARTDGHNWRTFRVGNSGLGNDNVHGILEDRSGTLWFSTDLWYTRYLPSPPEVRIERIVSLADGQTFTPTQGLTLGYTQRAVRVEFSARAPWTRPRDIVYRYRLKGWDQAWRFLDNPSDREPVGQVAYSQLMPGTYTFVVSAANRRLDYSEPVSLTFTVRSAAPVATIDGVVVDGVRYAGNVSLKTTPGRAREVGIEFHGEDDLSPTLQYRYRLDRGERQGEWMPVISSPLTLTLPAGAYLFSLQALDEEGNASDQVSSYLFVEELAPPTFRPAEGGYRYAFTLAESQPTTVTLEVWDPVPGARLWAGGAWRPQVTETVVGGGERKGQIASFDAFDVGRMSRARFWLDDGYTRSLWYTTDSFPVSGTPWTVYLVSYLVLAMVGSGGLFVGGRRWLTSSWGRAWRVYWRVRGSPTALWPATSALLEQESGFPVLERLSQIAETRGRAEVAEVARALVDLSRPDMTVEGLSALGEHLRRRYSPVPEGAVLWPEALRQALQAQTLATLTMVPLETSARYHGEVGDEALAAALEALAQVRQVLVQAHGVFIESQLAFLDDALDLLNDRVHQAVAGLPPLERMAFRHVVRHWRHVISEEREQLRGRARVSVRLLTRQVVASEEVVTIALALRNQGRGLARNVQVLISEPYGQEPIQLSSLLPGEHTTIEATLHPESERLLIRGVVRYDDRLAWGREEPFSGLVAVLPRPVGILTEVGNPYTAGRPLGPGSPVFVGRQEVFEFVRANVLGRSGQQVLALMGQRRMGKTSMIHQLPGYLGPDVVCVKLNCQGLGMVTDLASVSTQLVRLVTGAMKQAGLPLPRLDEEVLQASPVSALEQEFLPKVFEQLQGRPMLWMFDELEEWVNRTVSGRLAPEVFGFLRYLIESHEPLRVLIAGTDRLYRAAVPGVSPLLNLAMTRRLGLLGEEAARRLMVEPLRDVLLWDDLAMIRLLRLTGGHPYFLQAACWLLVDQCLYEQRGFIGPQDVLAVIEEVWQTCETHLEELWKLCNRPLERLLLVTLARWTLRPPGATAAQLSSYLADTHALRLKPDRVLHTLETLVQRQVLHQVEGERYAFLVPLFGRWVREMKSMGIVLEEVVDDYR